MRVAATAPSGRRGRRLLLPGLVLLTSQLWVSPATADVDEDEVCVVVRPEGDYQSRPPDAESSSAIAEPLRLAEAHGWATGKGIGVAVLDTGVDPAASTHLSMRSPVSVPGVQRKLYDGHGTWVAGLVAGHAEGEVLGVAPAAHVVPIRVADGGRELVESYSSQVALTGVTADNIARGIRAALARRRAQNIRVINISLSVREESPALERAVRAAGKAGVLVVAAAGNRPQPEAGATGPDEDAFQPGEDRVPFPARYDDVLAVTALAPDLSLAPSYVETGPGVDVAAPVVGAKTVGAEGQTCLLPSVATSWATAEVSGLAALVFERYPDLTAAQVRTRIEATARGVTSAHALDGHGMVQPVAALTAELDISRDGRLVRGEPEAETMPPLRAPVEAEDELADARRQFRWWGLFAGGALVLALLLRPLARRQQR